MISYTVARVETIVSESSGYTVTQSGSMASTDSGIGDNGNNISNSVTSTYSNSSEYRSCSNVAGNTQSYNGQQYGNEKNVTGEGGTTSGNTSSQSDGSNGVTTYSAYEYNASQSGSWSWASNEINTNITTGNTGGTGSSSSSTLFSTSYSGSISFASDYTSGIACGTTTSVDTYYTNYHTVTTQVASTITVPSITTSSYTTSYGTITQTSTSTYSFAQTSASSGTSTTQGDSFCPAGVFLTTLPPSTYTLGCAHNAVTDRLVYDTIWIAEKSDVLAVISNGSTWTPATDAATTTATTISASSEYTTLSNFDQSVTATITGNTSMLDVIYLQYGTTGTDTNGYQFTGVSTIGTGAMTDRFPMSTYPLTATVQTGPDSLTDTLISATGETVSTFNTSVSFSSNETFTTAYGVSYSFEYTGIYPNIQISTVSIPSVTAEAGTLGQFVAAGSTYVADMPLTGSNMAGLFNSASSTGAALAITGDFPFTIFDFPYSSNSTAQIVALPYGVFKTTISQSTTGPNQGDTVTVPVSQQTFVTGSYVDFNSLALSWIVPGWSDVSTGTASWTTDTGLPYGFADAASIVGGGGITPNNTTTEFQCGGAYLYTYGNSTTTSSSSYSLTDPAAATSLTGVAESVSVVLNVPLYQGTGVFVVPYPMGVYDTAHPTI